MRIKIPSKKVREGFLLVYELDGCQKAVNYLTRYYGARRMRIVLNGRKVGNGDEACYEDYVAYFTKKGLNKFNALHEFYHHLVYSKGLDMAIRIEEKEANFYARNFMR